MKHYRLFTLSLVVVVFLSAVLTTPSYAYPWSKTTKVTVPVKFQGIASINANNCVSATLYANGTSYAGSVNNPFLSNNCNLYFNTVPVKGTYYVEYKVASYAGLGLPSYRIYSTYVYVGVPLITNYTTKNTYYR